ncbi:RES family NAD+ phosphorylase [Streptomyces bambusae]|nr:RES family NAD+ phosphorylase [Streptomyces bambusae]MCB5164127.1 RES family NAD+ phosphorylase [Streptomyces bambusae]
MQPNSLILPAGTELWRVHSRTWAGDAFKDAVADEHFGGSRFDSTQRDPYPFLYTAMDPATALAETLLRSTPFDPATTTRLIPYAAVRNRSLSRLRTRCDVRLIALITEEDLAAVCQSSWLLEEEGDGRYAKTRRWAVEMRAQDPGAMGLVWTSRRHRPRLAQMMFGDRFGEPPAAEEDEGGAGRFLGGPPPELVPGGGIAELGSPSGVAEANRLLAPLRAAIVPPW